MFCSIVSSAPPHFWNKIRHQNVCYNRESASQCSQWGDWGGQFPESPNGVLGKETFFSEGLAHGCHFRSGGIQKSSLPGSSTLTNLAMTCVRAAWEDAGFVDLQIKAVSLSAWEPHGCQDLGVDCTCHSLDSRGGFTYTLDHSLWHSFLWAPHLGLGFSVETKDAICALKMPCMLVREAVPGPRGVCSEMSGILCWGLREEFRQVSAGSWRYKGSF